jgi:hypothetical protein
MRTKQRQPGQTAQAKALTFKPVKIDFSCDNNEWGRVHLAMVRIAVSFLAFDDKGLENTWRRLLQSDGEKIALDTLDDMSHTEQHLRALADLLRAAFARSCVALERLGRTRSAAERQSRRAERVRVSAQSEAIEPSLRHE